MLNFIQVSPIIGEFSVPSISICLDAIAIHYYNNCRRHDLWLKKHSYCFLNSMSHQFYGVTALIVFWYLNEMENIKKTIVVISFCIKVFSITIPFKFIIIYFTRNKISHLFLKLVKIILRLPITRNMYDKLMFMLMNYSRANECVHIHGHANSLRDFNSIDLNVACK